MGHRRVVHVLVLVALGAALVYAPVDAVHAWRDVRNGSAESRARRAETPALSVGLEAAREIEQAARVIPPSAQFAIRTGPGAAVRGPQSLDYAKFWALFTLLPRRAVTHPRDADWIVFYGGDPASAGVRLARVVDLGHGVKVAEVAR